MPEDLGPVSSVAVCSGTFYVYSSISNTPASYDLERGYSLEIVSCRTPLERDGQWTTYQQGEQAVGK